MITITDRLDKFESEIVCDNKDLLNQLKSKLTVEYEAREYNWKTKKYTFRKALFKLYKEVKNKTEVITITRSLSIPFVEYLRSNNVDVEYTPVEFKPIFITDTWKDIFRSHPREDYGKIQLDTAKLFETNVSGIISLFTGVGKTQIFLALADSFVKQFGSGNVVIITYSNKVLDEISLRAQSYGLEIGTRIKLINPTGYYKSNYSKTEEAISWLKDVDLVIADEAHHFSSLDGTWPTLVKDANPTYIYGFSATGDVSDGLMLDETIFNKKSNPQSMCLISFCGTTLISHELPVPIKVTRIYTDIADEVEYTTHKDKNPNALQFLTTVTLHNKYCPSIIAHAVDNYVPDKSICFIPELTSIETGVYLATELNRIGIPTVYYSASAVITPIGEVNNLTLEDLKGLAKQYAFKILISNAVGVEGIDIPNLSSIIPLTGVSFKNIIQPLGRSARADLVHCIFIFDKHNKLLTRQMKDKYKVVKDRLNVIADHRVEVPKIGLVPCLPKS